MVALINLAPYDNFPKMQPDPEEEVTVNTVVDLYYAIPETCEILDVTWYSPSDAEEVLTEAGCTVGERIGVSPEEYGVDEFDIVVDTEPEVYTRGEFEVGGSPEEVDELL